MRAAGAAGSSGKQGGKEDAKREFIVAEGQGACAAADRTNAKHVVVGWVLTSLTPGTPWFSQSTPRLLSGTFSA